MKFFANSSCWILVTIPHCQQSQLMQRVYVPVIKMENKKDAASYHVYPGEHLPLDLVVVGGDYAMEQLLELFMHHSHSKTQPPLWLQIINIKLS